MLQDILCSSPGIFESIPGFFDDDRHLQNQYEWVSRKTILDNIRLNSGIQFEFLLKVIQRWSPCQEVQNRIEAAQLKGVTHNNSQVPLQVCLLQELNVHWDKTRTGFIRFPDESEAETPSPHLVCWEEEDRLEFDLVAEGTTVYQRMSLNDALAAFFHLVFVAGMRYPDKGEGVCVWLQRKIACIDAPGMLFSKLLVRVCAGIERSRLSVI